MMQSFCFGSRLYSAAALPLSRVGLANLAS